MKTTSANRSALFYEGDRAQASYLAQRDPRLGQVIEIVGHIQRRIWPDAYAALLRAIIGQQISAKAQNAVWLRFCAAFPDFDPGVLATASPEQICRCGISGPKAGYMRGVARAFANEEITANSLNLMDDDQLRKTLGNIRGVGPWTVEMLMIFTFQRPNVLSFGDGAIRRSLCRLYGHEQLTRELFDRHHARYSPCATLAGMYLWELPKIDPGLLSKI